MGILSEGSMVTLKGTGCCFVVTGFQMYIPAAWQGARALGIELQ